MAESLFQKLEAEALRKGIVPHTRNAAEWFKNQLRGLKVDPSTVIKDERLIRENTPNVGDMYMFFYDPKTKKKLPYYDTFPLVVLLEPTKDGFYGLNLHYLSLPLRAKFLDALLETAKGERTSKSHFAIRMSVLKSVQRMKYYKPCIKRYLTSHVDSRIMKVQPTDWEMATFLPVQQFEKANATRVWRDSGKKIR